MLSEISLVSTNIHDDISNYFPTNLHLYFVIRGFLYQVTGLIPSWLQAPPNSLSRSILCSRNVVSLGDVSSLISGGRPRYARSVIAHTGLIKLCSF